MLSLEDNAKTVFEKIIKDVQKTVMTNITSNLFHCIVWSDPGACRDVCIFCWLGFSQGGGNEWHANQPNVQTDSGRI